MWENDALVPQLARGPQLPAAADAVAVVSARGEGKIGCPCEERSSKEGSVSSCAGACGAAEGRDREKSGRRSPAGAHSAQQMQPQSLQCLVASARCASLLSTETSHTSRLPRRGVNRARR